MSLDEISKREEGETISDDDSVPGHRNDEQYFPLEGTSKGDKEDEGREGSREIGSVCCPKRMEVGRTEC